MPGVPVDEVVLAPVGLVGDDHDVPALGEDRMGVSPFLGEEFLDGCENHPSDVDREFLPEVCPAFGLGRVLPEEFAAPGEGAEELVVQVVPVGEDDYGGVFHVGVPYQGAGVEGHGQALAGALVVPDDPDSPVPGISPVPSVALGRGSSLELGGPEGLLDRGLDGVELVISGHFLDEFPATVVIEYDEISEQRQEVGAVAHPFQHDWELGEVGGAWGIVVHGLPGLEPLLAGGQGADAGVEAVGYHQELVQGEQAGEFVLVGLELLPGVPDIGALIGRVLELDDADGQSVQEEDDIRPPGELVLLDGELVDGEPVVFVGVFEVDDSCGFSAHGPVVAPDGDGYSAGEGVVEGSVPGFQGRSVGVDQVPESRLQC